MARGAPRRHRAVWGDAAQRTSIEEVVDVTARRHEVRRTFVAEDASSRIHEHSGAPVEHGDAATEFALANGFRQTLLDLRQDLALPVSEETLARLDPGTDPTAYVIETAVDALPEEWLEDRALLARRMSTDAPSGDIDLDEEDWDAERVRQLWNTPSPIWGIETVARHVPTDRLVAFTDLVVRPGQPDLAVQSDTLVLREHRGHALGLASKLANLRGLQRARPDVTSVRTWNADTNVHMIAINERLGFVVTGWTREWAKDLRASAEGEPAMPARRRRGQVLGPKPDGACPPPDRTVDRQHPT